jgi:hypothetical protein
MSFTIARNRVDLPVEDGPIRYRILMVDGFSIAGSRLGKS